MPNIINKIKTDSNTYDISPSPSGTLEVTGELQYVSNDVNQSEATSYENVIRVSEQDNNASIFSKFTTMCRNLRYIFNALGTTDITAVGSTITDAVNNLNNNKANSNHTHQVEDLPVVNEYEDNDQTIPTSHLMNQTEDSMQSQTHFPDYIMTNVDVGSLGARTWIRPDDLINDILFRMLRREPGEDEYTEEVISTWNSTNDIKEFFQEYHNGFEWQLKLGSRIQINDGTYNAEWIVAGFDCEYDRTASDGTPYDNGFGLCLIPSSPLVSSIAWNSTTPISVSGGYKDSSIRAYLSSTVLPPLQTLLSSYLIERDVLVTNGIDSETQVPSSAEWVKDCLTLLSTDQIVGSPLDDEIAGEANYYLPVFDFFDYKRLPAQKEEELGMLWTRACSCIPMTESEESSPTAFVLDQSGNLDRKTPDSTGVDLVPMIYVNGPGNYWPEEVATWESAADVDAFFTEHTAENGWDGLQIGNTITINTDSGKTRWQIAGFDCEENQTAADGTQYTNGKGILLIAHAPCDTSEWYDSSSASEFSGYMTSKIHTEKLNGATDSLLSTLSPILGSHLVNRQVLLGSSINTTEIGSACTTNYTWTTAYFTLPSIGQLSGVFGENLSGFDDGEATYQLPLMEYAWVGDNNDNYESFWYRNMERTEDGQYNAYCSSEDRENHDPEVANSTDVKGLYPIMYLR